MQQPDPLAFSFISNRRIRRGVKRTALHASATELSRLDAGTAPAVLDVDAMRETVLDLENLSRSLSQGKAFGMAPERLADKKVWLGELTKQVGRHHKGICAALENGDLSDPRRLEAVHRNSKRLRDLLQITHDKTEEFDGQPLVSRGLMEEILADMARTIAKLFEMLAGKRRRRPRMRM